MATHGRGRARTRESRNEQPTNNHAEFMAVMTNLANIMEANAAVTLQAVQRLAQPAGSRNKNGEGAEGNLRGVPRTLAAFRKADPPVFTGSTNHTEANNWFQAMERALLTQHVPYDQFVEHAAYQLVGEAQQWWQGERRLLHQQNMNITWALFEEAFYKKYFLESIKEARELEFLQLKQRSMNIAEYTSKFEKFCKFSRISKGAPESYEGWKCIKYEPSSISAKSSLGFQGFRVVLRVNHGKRRILMAVVEDFGLVMMNDPSGRAEMVTRHD
ncbi:hypothetical protein AHAS_Ahas13G0382300 [Arachis hypogaea]